MVALLLVLLAASVPLAARGAADFQLTANAGTEYDSNVFHERSDPGDDYSLRLSAQASVIGSEPRLAYRMDYYPTYRRFLGRRNDDDVDHVASGQLRFDLDEHTRLELNENLQSLRHLGQDRIVVDRGGVAAVVADDEILGERSFRNRLGASLVRGFGTRWRGSLSASHDYFDPLSNDRISGQSMGASLGGSYGWDAWNVFGASVGSTLQLFEGDSFRPPSSTTAYQLSGSWSHVLDANTAISLSAGPALLVTRQDRFGRFSSRTGSRWTVFASGRVNRRWSQFWDSSLSYDRSQSDASGLSQSTIRDSVSFRTTWQPRERWDFGLGGDWARRQSTDSRLTGGDLDDERWTVSARGAYRLTRRTRLTASLRYNIQQRKRSGTVEDFTGFVGVNYSMGPWRLWN